jgi:hypothetical protein
MTSLIFFQRFTSLHFFPTIHPKMLAAAGTVARACSVFEAFQFDFAFHE